MDPLPVALSRYGALSREPSPVNRMMGSFAADFRDDRDINLGVGYVNEATIPRDLLRDSLDAVLRQPDRYRAALNYGGPRGSENLIASIARLLEPAAAAANPPREIIIGPNGATGLLESIAHVLPTGIVITTDPMYYIYCNLLERLGYEIVAVPEDDQGLRPELLDRKLEELGTRRREISFFYVVTVNNPTSTILANKRRRELITTVERVSRELQRPVPLILDKAYEQLIHDPAVPLPEPAAKLDPAGLTYEIGTLSKILAPGLRIGYLAGPAGDFLDALVQRTSDAGFSAPLINQELASYFLDHHLEAQMARVNSGYREKAAEIRACIDAILGTALGECRGGQAGFYFYLTFGGIETGTRSPFFRYLARTTGMSRIDGPQGDGHPRVVYIPGDYCVHSGGDMVEVGRRQLRLSYGFEETDRVRQALVLIGEAVDFATGR